MINDEALIQTKSLSTQLSLTTNQRNPGCVIAGNTGNVVCNTSFTNLSDSRVKTEMAKADVAELQQLFDSVEAKQYKRPDMNEDLRLGFASDDFAGTKWKNLTGTARCEVHGDGHPRLLSPHQRALQGVQGLPGPAGRGGRLAGPAKAEEAIRNMADARIRTIKGVYEDPRTGFGSIAQTLQQAQARDPSISREEVKAFLDGLRVNQDRRREATTASGAHEPAAGGPGRHEGLRGQALPLHAGGHRCADQESGRGAAEGPSCEHHRGGHEEGVPSPGGAGSKEMLLLPTN